MTFTYDGADLSTIIAGYKKDGHNYHIEYLDSSTTDYVSYDDNEEKKIINKMVQQAVDRKNNLNYEDETIKNYSYLAISAISEMSSLNCTKEERHFLAAMFFILSFSSFAFYVTEREKIKELKKYKMFLEMTKDNPSKGLNDEWLNYIECDKIYQIPMNINTLDNYNYSDVKYIYKKFNFKKNKDK